MASLIKGRCSRAWATRTFSRAAPENEEELLHFAHAGTTAHVERLVRGWRRVDRLEEIQEASDSSRARRTSIPSSSV